MQEFLTPVSEEIKSVIGTENLTTIGQSISVHRDANSFPDIDNTDIAIIGIREGRNKKREARFETTFTEVRRQLYQMYTQKWGSLSISDLGDVRQGETIKDSHVAVCSVVSDLLKKKCILILLGGAHHVTYANYLAYAFQDGYINMACVDSRLDIHPKDNSISGQSFIGKMIVDKPNFLFDFSLLGYQSFFMSEEHRELLEKLHFNHLRLGIISSTTIRAEPNIRNSDIVSIDLACGRMNLVPGVDRATISGLSDFDLCSLARYSGLSNKVSSFGIYGYDNQLDVGEKTAQLIAQMLWYFIDGCKDRISEYPHIARDKMIKYIVPVEGKDIVFYKNQLTDRYWLQIVIESEKRTTQDYLIPCGHEDYLEACNNNIPDIWWRHFKKIL